MGRPSTRISKWRWGPVECPVLPTRAITCPAATKAAGSARMGTEMGVEARPPAAVVHEQCRPEAGWIERQDLQLPGCGRVHGSTLGSGEVDAGMKIGCRRRAAPVQGLERPGGAAESLREGSDQRRLPAGRVAGEAALEERRSSEHQERQHAGYHQRRPTQEASQRPDGQGELEAGAGYHRAAVRAGLSSWATSFCNWCSACDTRRMARVPSWALECRAPGIFSRT